MSCLILGDRRNEKQENSDHKRQDYIYLEDIERGGFNWGREHGSEGWGAGNVCITQRTNDTLSLMASGSLQETHEDSISGACAGP